MFLFVHKDYFVVVLQGSKGTTHNKIIMAIEAVNLFLECAHAIYFQTLVYHIKF